MRILEETMKLHGPGVRFIPSAELRAIAGRKLVLANRRRTERGEAEIHLLREGDKW